MPVQPQPFAVQNRPQPHRARKIARMRRIQARLDMVQYPIGEEKKSRLARELRQIRLELGAED